MISILVGLVVVALGAFAWVKYVYQPSAAEAEGQMAIAEQNFRADGKYFANCHYRTSVKN